MTSEEHIARAEKWAEQAELEIHTANSEREPERVVLSTHAAGMARMHVALATVLMQREYDARERADAAGPGGDDADVDLPF